MCLPVDLPQPPTVIEEIHHNPHLENTVFSTAYTIRPGKPTDQKDTARCWIFSASNMLRVAMRDYLGEDFAFSYNYVAFWDKYERANYFFERMMELASHNPESREIDDTLLRLHVEGGEWEFFVNVVKKHGIVPDYAMPETKSSEDSDDYLRHLTTRLREIGGILHSKARAGASRDDLQAIKEQGLREIKNILTLHLGNPPQYFSWGEKRLTPLEFAKSLPKSLDDFVHVVHFPQIESGVKVRVKGVNNRVGGKPLEGLNLPMEDIKAAIRRSVKQGMPLVCTMETKWLDKKCKFYSLEAQPHDDVYGFDRNLRLSKAERLIYRVSKLQHLMTIIGCDDEDTIHESDLPYVELREPFWKLENSYEGIEELFTSDRWLDEYLFAIVIEKKYLTEKERELLETEAHELESWDPFGRI